MRQTQISFAWSNDKKLWVWLSWKGYESLATHWRGPTTDPHGDSWLLGFPPGPVCPSLDNLMLSGSPDCTMLMQALVRTLDQHELMTNSIPILKLSYRTCLHVAGLQEHATAPSRYEWLKYWIWETLVITMTCGQILEFKVCKQLYWCEYSYGTN